jgi:aminoglycoside phosphotransferase family enzyme
MPIVARAYRDAGGDPGPDSLIAFYAACRALVRAKVSLVRAASSPARAGNMDGGARTPAT